jgi:hypothetical protein
MPIYTEKEKEKLIAMLPHSDPFVWSIDKNKFCPDLRVYYYKSKYARRNRLYNLFGVRSGYITKREIDSLFNRDYTVIKSSNLIEVENFLYHFDLEEVPLYINEYPELVKFRLEIGK